MLFDLRGRGRRNTVRGIYLLLAFLMGGGLVLFGIGGATNGGLVDAITGSSGGDTGEKRFTKRETAALERLQANPQNLDAHIELIRARISLAGVGERYDANTNTYTAEGKATLRKAVDAWNDYQALNPPASDEQARVASVMVGAFTALEDWSGAAGAQEIVAENRGTAGPYSNLAVLAYQAGQTRKGDLAAAKALELTPKDLRKQLKTQLDQAKAQSAVSAAASATPTP